MSAGDSGAAMMAPLDHACVASLGFTVPLVAMCCRGKRQPSVPVRLRTRRLTRPATVDCPPAAPRSRSVCCFRSVLPARAADCMSLMPCVSSSCSVPHFRPAWALSQQLWSNFYTLCLKEFRVSQCLGGALRRCGKPLPSDQCCMQRRAAFCSSMPRSCHFLHRHRNTRHP